MSHFEYCNSLLIGVNKTLKKKLEDANQYGLRTIMNMGKNSDYESLLKIGNINSLEHRRIEQSSTIFFKCFKEDRITSHNIRNTGCFKSSFRL